jgi:hypothetical protein
VISTGPSGTASPENVAVLNCGNIEQDVKSNPKININPKSDACPFFMNGSNFLQFK